MTDLDRVIVPGLTHWESKSRFFAYFKGHSAYPAVRSLHSLFVVCCD